MRTGNPTLRDKMFNRYGQVHGHESMTIDGTVNKTFILLLLLCAVAGMVWGMFFVGNYTLVSILMIVGIVGGLVLALITAFKQQWSATTAPLYAVFEGMVIGGLSAILEQAYPGIVIEAVGLTFGVLFVLLFVYKARIIKVTENFKIGVIVATGAIVLVYFVTAILNMFGTTIPYIHDSGVVGILFSLFVVAIAAMNLVLDFDFIENAAKSHVPKFMEWYGAFALMVTLIWLYVEILRLLAKVRSNE
jgi:uncharacterized YccA/Bax inhibitor family protein